VTHRLWRLAYLVVIVYFLAVVASYYSRDTGFTIFLGLPANSHGYELQAVQAIPHAHDETGTGYDGQFYAQMAIDPLLRDAAIDRAMDNPGYRAHRILFSWTAWLLGLGRPAWILQAYAVQNVLAWLALAWVLCVWCPPRDARTFILWTGVMLSHGLLISVRNAVPDGPSILLIACAVWAADRGRPLVAAAVTGIAGLARETNLMAGIVLLRSMGRVSVARRVLWFGAAGVLCVLPLALWLDYLRSIYQSGAFAGGDHITMPLSGLWWKLQTMKNTVMQNGLTAGTVGDLAWLLGFAGQGAALVWCTRQRHRTGEGSRSWLLVAWMFLCLALVAHRVIWNGSPGAITRVILPLAVGVNAALAASPRAPWTLIVAANLGVAAGLTSFAAA